MSIEYCLNERVIKIDDNNYLLIKTKTEECYLWEEVFLLNNNESILIGSYSQDHYSRSERMENNNNYIVFLKTEYGYGENYIDYRDDDFGYLGKRITKMFDIKNKRFVTAKDEVLSIYNTQFNNGKSEEKVFYDEAPNNEKTSIKIRNKN